MTFHSIWSSLRCPTRLGPQGFSVATPSDSDSAAAAASESESDLMIFASTLPTTAATVTVTGRHHVAAASRLSGPAQRTRSGSRPTPHGCVQSQPATVTPGPATVSRSLCLSLVFLICTWSSSWDLILPCYGATIIQGSIPSGEQFNGNPIDPSLDQVSGTSTHFTGGAYWQNASDSSDAAFFAVGYTNADFGNSDINSITVSQYFVMAKINAPSPSTFGDVVWRYQVNDMRTLLGSTRGFQTALTTAGDVLRIEVNQAGTHVWVSGSVIRGAQQRQDMLMCMFDISGANPDVYGKIIDNSIKLEWCIQDTGTETGVDRLFDLVVDRSSSPLSDRIYTVGHLAGSVYLTALNSTGHNQWTYKRASGSTDEFQSVALDSQAEYVYVCGQTKSSELAFPLVGGNEAIVYQFQAADGVANYVWQFASPVDDIATGIAMSRANAIFVTGTTYGSILNPSLGNQGTGVNVWVARITPGGQTVWTAMVSSAEDDYASDIAVSGYGDDNDIVCIGGYTEGNLIPGITRNDRPHVFVIAYRATGSEIYRTQFPSQNQFSYLDTVIPLSYPIGSVAAFGQVGTSQFRPKLGAYDAMAFRYDIECYSALGTFCNSTFEQACTLGSYCPANSTADTDCAAGSYCSNTSSIVACTSIGAYCPPRSTVEGICPVGYYCPDASDALLCSNPGRYCPAGSTSELPCPPGFYCPNAQTVLSCSLGSYCPTGSSTENSCPIGSFCPNSTIAVECTTIGAYCGAGSVSQQPCPAGSFCTNPSTRVVCTQNGAYCPSGSTSQGVCPVGYVCSVPASKQICSIGSFCPSGTTQQLLCPAGFFCPNASIHFVCGSTGSYCPSGSTTEGICPAGSVCSSPTDISPCGSGSYCPNATRIELPCAAGYFCPSPAERQLCPPNSFCPLGSSTVAICPAGSYCPNPSTSILCNAAGAYCPAGSVSQRTCPAGYVCSSSSTSQLCPSGAYCPNGTVVESPCTPGHYCPTPTQRIPCGSNSFCPSGSVAPGVCPAGSACPTSAQTVVCSSGSFCPAGTSSEQPCPAGSFCSNPATIQACLTIGAYCPQGSITSTLCPAGQYCTSPASVPQPCSSGSYCPVGSTTDTPCPVGSYCPTLSSIQPCTSRGAYCPAGSMSEGVCAAGFFCVNPTSQTACQTQGAHCPRSSIIETICPEDYFCPTPSEIYNCTGADTYCPRGSIQESLCPAGYYCTGRTVRTSCSTPGAYCAAGSTSQSLCRIGHYCPTPAEQRVCPTGTICPEGSTLAAPCNAGYYCSSPSVLAPTPCAATYYCPAGSSNQSLCLGGYYCPSPAQALLCPFGSSCPSGSLNHRPCPTGQFSDRAGSEDCIRCPVGTTTAGAGAVDATECAALLDLSTSARDELLEKLAWTVAGLAIGVFSASIVAMIRKQLVSREWKLYPGLRLAQSVRRMLRFSLTVDEARALRFIRVVDELCALLLHMQQKSHESDQRFSGRIRYRIACLHDDAVTCIAACIARAVAGENIELTKDERQTLTQCGVDKLTGVSRKPLFTFEQPTWTSVFGFICCLPTDGSAPSGSDALSYFALKRIFHRWLPVPGPIVAMIRTQLCCCCMSSTKLSYAFDYAVFCSKEAEVRIQADKLWRKVEPSVAHLVSMPYDQVSGRDDGVDDGKAGSGEQSLLSQSEVTLRSVSGQYSTNATAAASAAGLVSSSSGVELMSRRTHQ
jgi:hypothetical protein